MSASYCTASAVYVLDCRTTKQWIESLTDELATPAYSSLEPSELDQLIADLEPITAALDAAGSR
jgi:hypothetical protein